MPTAIPVAARTIFVKPGDVVAAGQPLLRIDPARQTAALAQAQAMAAARRAALDLAEINLARVRELVQRGALSGQELDNARAQQRTAWADLEVFLRRPILAAVLAMLTVIGGAIAIPSLPVARYPALAAPQVIVSSVYIGASSEVVEAAVTTPLRRDRRLARAPAPRAGAGAARRAPR